MHAPDGDTVAPLDPGDALRTLLRERADDARATLESVRRITASLDVRTIVAEAVTLATEAARCPIGAIYLLDEAEQRLWIRATSPGYEEMIDTYSLDVGAGLTGWTALNRVAAIVNDDPHDDPRYVSVPEVDLDFYAALTVPMIAPSERLVGVVTLHTRAPGRFTDDDRAAVAPLAALCAAALETAQLQSRSRRQVELLRSVRDLGDATGSPSATRAALTTLCESARLLLEGASVALYVRRGAAWRLVSWSPPGPGLPQDELAAELVAALTISDEPVRLLREDHRELFEALAAADDGHGVAVRLDAGGEVVGLSLCLRGSAALSSAERELFGIIASVSAMLIQGDRIAERLAPRSADLALLLALSEGTEAPAAVAARARQLGIDLAASSLALRVQPADRGGAAAAADGALRALEAALTARVPGTVASVHDLELLALTPAGDATVERVEAAVRDVETSAGVRLAGGLSGLVAGLGEHVRAFGDARDALQIGKALGGPGHVVAYDALGAQRHLWTLARSSARDPFLERLEILRRHDAEHASSLLDTVEGYLEEYGHRERASQRLRVHRNTLRLRLERIRALSGIDLEDPSIQFDVQTALGILRFRDLQTQGVRSA